MKVPGQSFARFRLTLVLVLLGLSGASARAQDEKPDYTLDPKFGAVSQQSGFAPYTKEVTAGGSIKTNLGGVDAYVTREPTFRFRIGDGNETITIHVTSEAETTLLINLPNQQWVADHRGKAGPKIVSCQRGQYDIWVGTPGKDSAKAELKITGYHSGASETHQVFTLKYKDADACKNAINNINTNYKSAHVLTAYESFVDVFVAEGKLNVPTAGLEWSDLVERVPVRIPRANPLVEPRAGDVPMKIIPDERDKVFGKTGKRVLLAIIDSGIDFRHQDFWRDAGDKKETRLLYYWDTAVTNKRWAGDKDTTKLLATYPDGTPLGRLYSRDNINVELNRPQKVPVWSGGPTDIWTDDCEGHGTGCAAIAAGQGSKNGTMVRTMPGVAPDVDLIVVRCLEPYLYNAVFEWLEQVAKDENKPLVISTSQGTSWGGGYDGKRGQDQHLNARLSRSKKGLAVCMCAGNEGVGAYNTHVELDPKGKAQTKIDWDAPLPARGAQYPYPKMVFYFNTDRKEDIDIQGDNKDFIKLINEQMFFHGPSGSWRTREFYLPNKDYWKGSITVKAAGARPLFVDAYIWSGHPMDNKGTIKADLAKGDGKIWHARINSPATIENCITVGAYNWFAGDIMDGKVVGKLGMLSTYSSPGFRRGDPKRTACPWLAAPGERFTVPRANTRDVKKDMNGSSSATPYTAGFVALMFECNKNLTFDDVRKLLADPDSLTHDEAAMQDAFGNVLDPVANLLDPQARLLILRFPNSHWGYGKLDNPAANRILAKLLRAGAN